MKHIIKVFSMLIGVLLVAVSCETEMVEPIDIFSLETGGYMRIVSGTTCVSSGTIKKTNMAGTNMTMLHEAVTADKGVSFTAYELQIRYVGPTAATTTAYFPLRTINASDYKADGTTGYPRHTLVVTGAEALTATKLDTAGIKAGQTFDIIGTMKLSNGKAFNKDNTGLNITGGSFYCSPFRYTMTIAN